MGLAGSLSPQSWGLWTATNGVATPPVTCRFMAARMLTLDDVAEELAISKSQVYALVRRGDLPAGKIGGRGQWRVDRAHLEAYIERTWAETAAWVKAHPFVEGEQPP